MTTIRMIAIGLAAGLVSFGASAAPMGYNIAWSGSSGYSLAGMFSYEDTGQRVLRQSDLSSFMIEGFRNGRSIGSWSGTPELFVYRAGSSKLDNLLQGWNAKSAGVGFGCLLTGCGLTKDHRIVWRSLTGLTPVEVSPKTAQVALSEPASLALLLAGLAAFGLRRRAKA